MSSMSVKKGKDKKTTRLVGRHMMVLVGIVLAVTVVLLLLAVAGTWGDLGALTDRLTASLGTTEAQIERGGTQLVEREADGCEDDGHHDHAAHRNTRGPYRGQ